MDREQGQLLNARKKHGNIPLQTAGSMNDEHKVQTWARDRAGLRGASWTAGAGTQEKSSCELWR
jgi:hypothetical protein